MAIVRLETREAKFVSYATIHEMNPPPEILLWGERMFVLVPPVKAAGRPSSPSAVTVLPLYREGLLVMVPDPTPRVEP